MATAYTTVSDSSLNGPLVSGGFTSVAFNQAVSRAEAGQPEGQRIRLQIDSVNLASTVISQVNSAYQNGQIKDPSTGELVQGWPEYPGQVAFSFNGGNGIELRWLKGQIWAYIIVALVIAVIAVIVFESLKSSPYRMQVPGSAGKTGTGAPASAPFFGFMNGQLYLFYVPWYVTALGVGALAVAPWILDRLGAFEHGEASLVEGRQELRQAEGGG